MQNDNNKSLFDLIIERHAIVPKFSYNEQVYYDTKGVFERHNFSRQVKRNLDAEEYVINEGKYYLSQQGILRYAAITRNNKVLDSLMTVLTAASVPEATEVYASPVPQQEPLDLAMYMQPSPIAAYPQQQSFVYPPHGMYYQQQPAGWTFQSLYPQKQ